MIPVPRPPEPPSFDADVRQPGKRWLASGAKGRPPTLWRAAKSDLAAAFSGRCGYTAMYDLNGTVDHFQPQSRDRANLYEWDNLRHASQWINSSKKAREGILDPYEVEDGWFEVLLPSLQLVMTDEVPVDRRALLESTLEHLPIRDDERVIRQRRAWLEQYELGNVTLDGLRAFAPLLAAALEKQETDDRRGKAGGSKKGTPKQAARKQATRKQATPKQAAKAAPRQAARNKVGKRSAGRGAR